MGEGQGPRGVGDRGQERVQARGRAGVHQDVAHLPGADHPLASQVPHVDGPDLIVHVAWAQGGAQPYNSPMSGPPETYRLPDPDRPWIMRTYAGHSNARASNELYRRNLAKGQTGLSVAFDLPT